MLAAALVAAGLVAGVTGAWSPCGFSMVDTLAPHGYAGRLRTSVLACATFAAGALAGGVVTFGGLGLLGRALGAGGPAAASVAAAVALAAAVGEARGARILPQVRRQVPEAWRRVLPLPLAAGLYGVLLGLGFTTFILSFAVWALAAASVAVGDPALGALLGAGFGAGRALPVVALAPAAGTPGGAAVHAAMAERPAILRGLRAVDAVALALCALALGTGEARAAAEVVSRGASDPSAEGGDLAWNVLGGTAAIRRGGRVDPLPGRDPALAPGLVAWRDGTRLVLAARDTLAPVGALDAPGTDAHALSARWLAWRVHSEQGDAIFAAPLGAPLGPPRELARAVAPRELGRPAIDGDRLVYGVSGRGGSRLEEVNLVTGGRRVLRRERSALLASPAVLGGELLYVRSTFERQQLRLGAFAPRRLRRDRVLLSALPPGRRDSGAERGRHRHEVGPDSPRRLPRRPPAGVTSTLWSTALAPDAAYVTRLRAERGRPLAAVLLRVPRRLPG